MQEEKEIFKPKLRITTLSENGNPLSDRLVDACTEMYAGPKVQHKGPIRIEVTLVNQQDISQFKEYLDKLSGNLPIKESAGRGRPSNTQSKELESPREDILADVEKMVNEGKSQQDIIKYLRDLGFVFILTEDFLYHFPEFKFDKKDVGEPTNNGQYLDSYSWMARCIKRAKDPKTAPSASDDDDGSRIHRFPVVLLLCHGDRDRHVEHRTQPVADAQNPVNHCDHGAFLPVHPDAEPRRQLEHPADDRPAV